MPPSNSTEEVASNWPLPPSNNEQLVEHDTGKDSTGEQGNGNCFERDIAGEHGIEGNIEVTSTAPPEEVNTAGEQDNKEILEISATAPPEDVGT